MNIKLLRKVQKQILKEPRQFQMSDLYENHLSGIKIPNCGTAACIAGWIGAITLRTNPLNARHGGIVGVHYSGEKIGVGFNEAYRLFFFDEWPEQFTRITKEGTSAFAKQAARRIDHFIKTNGAE